MSIKYITIPKKELKPFLSTANLEIDRNYLGCTDLTHILSLNELETYLNNNIIIKHGLCQTRGAFLKYNNINIYIRTSCYYHYKFNIKNKNIQIDWTPNNFEGAQSLNAYISGNDYNIIICDENNDEYDEEYILEILDNKINLRNYEEENEFIKKEYEYKVNKEYEYIMKTKHSFNNQNKNIKSIFTKTKL